MACTMACSEGVAGWPATAALATGVAAEATRVVEVCDSVHDLSRALDNLLGVVQLAGFPQLCNQAAAFGGIALGHQLDDELVELFGVAEIRCFAASIAAIPLSSRQIFVQARWQRARQ